jgi:hypothetical protein
MDLADYKLKRLDLEYAECIAAGERAAATRNSDYASIRDACSDEGYEPLTMDDSRDEEATTIDTPALPSHTHSSSIEPMPLTPEEVERIKSHMSSIQLKHKPDWASSLTDEQFRKIFAKIFSSDNNQ